MVRRPDNRGTCMSNVVTLVLGGGRGTRLYPLTKYRSKPAVPVAGKYRLIDIPLSNCINSGLNRIYVVTQFNSVSLHRHIRSTYTFDPFDRGFVEILAAQQTLQSADWYQGHGRRRTAEFSLRKTARHRLRLDSLRRSALPDGLQPDDRHSPEDRRRRHHFGGAGGEFRSRRPGHHEVGRYRPGGGISREAQERARVGPRPHRSRLDRRPGYPKPRPRLSGQHGDLPLQSPDAGRRTGKDRLPGLRQGGLSGFHADPPRSGTLVRRLLGRHRDDQVLFRGQPESRVVQSAV